SFLKALACAEQSQAELPGNRDRQFQVAVVQSNLAMLLGDVQRPVEAESYSRKSIDRLNSLVAAHPAVRAYRNCLADTYHEGGLLLRGLKRPREAEEAYRQAVRLQESLVREFPQVPEYRSNLGATLNNLATLRKDAKQPEEALALIEEAIRRQQGAVK